MKFCLDARTATDHFPGIGRYVSNLARSMGDQLEDDERLIVLRDPARPSRWELPKQQGRVNTLEATVSPFGIAQQWRVPGILNSNGVAVYHSPYYLMPYWPGKPTVVTIYDLIPQFYPHYVSKRARLLFRLATWFALRAADHVICISEATRKDLLAAYSLNPKRVSAIPLAPDPIFRPQPEGEVQRVRTKFGLPERFVLYLGINKPHKNLVALVEAWVQMKTEAPLVIAGAWDERYPQVKERVAALGLGAQVRFLGPISNDDQPALYAAATVFVFPSMYEGFGLPVIEAMACGTAVVCSNRSSLPEAAGEGALLFDPGQANEIVEAITGVLIDKQARENLRKRGLLQARKFTWEHASSRTLSLYRKLSQ